MTFVDRYHDVGLRRNPFSAQALEQSTLFIDQGFAPVAPWSRSLVQLVGDKGHGKTTHLRHFQRSSPGPFHYVPEIPRRHRWRLGPMCNGAGTVYGDEIDRMPRPLRARWFRKLAKSGTTLVIGTHVDLAHIGQSAGFDVITYHLQPFDRSTIAGWIDQLMRNEAIEGTTKVGFSEADLDEIYRASCGVPRQAEVLCHAVIAEMVAHHSAANRTD